MCSVSDVIITAAHSSMLGSHNVFHSFIHSFIHSFFIKTDSKRCFSKCQHVIN